MPRGRPPNSKRDFNIPHTPNANNILRRGQKITWKMPISIFGELKNSKLKQYELRSFQELFDYLIISGIIYLRQDIIEYVDKHIEFYRERFHQSCGSRFGTTEEPEFEEFKRITFNMFPYDYENFGRYLAERNIKRSWVYEILFRGFIQEEKIIIELIDACKKAKVRDKKKTIARLTNDDYIKILPKEEQKSLLKQLTLNYDNFNFDSLLIKEIQELKTLQMKQSEAEQEIDEEFERKISALRLSRTNELNKITDEVIK